MKIAGKDPFGNAKGVAVTENGEVKVQQIGSIVPLITKNTNELIAVDTSYVFFDYKEDFKVPYKEILGNLILDAGAEFILEVLFYNGEDDFIVTLDNTHETITSERIGSRILFTIKPFTPYFKLRITPTSGDRTLKSFNIQGVI